MEPISNPIITHLLVKEWWEKAQTPKPTALNTPLRYSSAYACARQQSYAAFGAKQTEPMDQAGAWVTGVGTLIHEALQEAIGRQFPNAVFELGTAHGEYISGSCDAYIPSSDLAGVGNTLYELKTMGTFSFDKQVGWNRMRGEYKYPEGPAQKAIAQAGINALGVEKHLGVNISNVVLGSITFEALSVQKAQKMGVSDYNRVLAEFWFTREEWEPLAIAELERMSALGELVTNGYLGAREARDDEGNTIILDPLGRDWQCAYCAFNTVCQQDGSGIIRITDSNAVPTSQEGNL
jgi:hypothetical protein